MPKALKDEAALDLAGSTTAVPVANGLSAPTILIVDDVDMNRRLMRAMLKTAHYRILEAKRPTAAITILEREKVDLVVVDLVMPQMSGPDICRVLKQDKRT